MGFMGLGSWVESDNAADCMAAVERSIGRILKEELRDKANCYNTPGFVSVALVLESFPDLSMYDETLYEVVVEALTRLNGSSDWKKQFPKDHARLVAALVRLKMRHLA